MNKAPLRSAASAVILLGCGAVIGAMLQSHSVAQTPAPAAPPSSKAHEVPKWIWPNNTDAPIAAPRNHKVLYEDDHVVLLEVTVRPGETEKMHGHRYPSVFVYDAMQPKLVDHDEHGKIDHVIDRSLVDAKFPACHPLGIQPPHQVTNVDTFSQHFYRVEFKRIDDGKVADRHYGANN